MEIKKGGRALLTVTAIIVWFALILQLYLILKNRVASVPETITRYFGFFTILTNIVVAFCATSILINSKSAVGRFLSRRTTIAAITVYIAIVGIVYNSILRFQWKPQGLDKVADELLHLIVPLLFILFWLLFIPKSKLQWKNIFPWLWFPFLYLIFILIRGPIAGYYPYPFIDVILLGYSQVLINSVGMLAAFLIVSVLVVFIDRSIKKTGAY